MNESNQVEAISVRLARDVRPGQIMGLGSFSATMYAIKRRTKQGEELGRVSKTS